MFATPWTLMTTGGPWQFFREWWIVLSNQLKRSGKREVLWEVACMLWHIWKARNYVVFEKLFVPPDIVIVNGLKLAMDFTKAGEARAQVEQSGIAAAEIPRARWQPPRVSFVKINCDGGWSKDSLAGTSGVVCRASNGDFRGASFRRMEWVASSLVAEAYAVRDRLHFSCKVELESDSKTLIESLMESIGERKEVIGGKSPIYGLIPVDKPYCGPPGTSGV
ncbi:hypothetical protein LIER_16160 [Lithospermum erythrorhizon]|uniref:RNase H type-1 domain-containing protein n=1 Tax=Lithospermum erythrorhizon TaxID=34254 RepID=A0AAV3Q6I9_LITER